MTPPTSVAPSDQDGSVEGLGAEGEESSAAIDYSKLGGEALAFTLGVAGGAAAFFLKDRRQSVKVVLESMRADLDAWTVAVDGFREAIAEARKAYLLGKDQETKANVADRVRTAQDRLEECKARLLPSVTSTGVDTRREEQFWDRFDQLVNDYLQYLVKSEAMTADAYVSAAPGAAEKGLKTALATISFHTAAVRNRVDSALTSFSFRSRRLRQRLTDGARKEVPFDPTSLSS